MYVRVFAYDMYANIMNDALQSHTWPRLILMCESLGTITTITVASQHYPQVRAVPTTSCKSYNARRDRGLRPSHVKHLLSEFIDFHCKVFFHSCFRFILILLMIWQSQCLRQWLYVTRSKYHSNFNTDNGLWWNEWSRWSVCTRDVDHVGLSSALKL